MVLTNGAGGSRHTWHPGQPVLIADHINLTGGVAARGCHASSTSPTCTRCACATSRDRSTRSSEEGVYCQFRGPQYETPAEVRMAKAIGGHIVGMSTALEAIAARQAGMEVLGFSLDHQPGRGHPDHPARAISRGGGGAATPNRVISSLLARVIGAL